MSDDLDTLKRIFWANKIYIQRGDVAPEGNEEYLPSYLFDAVDYDRWILGKGILIRIYDPKAAKNIPARWEHKNTTEVGKNRVPAGFKVEVIDGRVKMTKSAVG